MTTKADREWAAWVAARNADYDALVAQMEADGWTVVNRGGRFGGEHFTKDGQAVRLVRQMGSTVWYPVPYEEAKCTD